MRRATTAFFTILLVVSLIIFQIPAAADEATLPKPLTPQLSADGNTLYNGGSVLSVVVDPNPSTPLRRIPAPAGISDNPEATITSFSITYIPDGGTDKWDEPCYTFPEEAKTCFNAAANIWANTFNSDVPITINACWAHLTSPSILGYSGGGSLHRDFTGATRSNTWYSVSLANALYGSDLNPSLSDMHITYNANFNWYYGTDGNTPPTQYDLMTVVLHEICHGLNFSGSMRYSGGSGSWGYGTVYPNIYDVFMRDGSGTQLIDTGSYENGSTALGSAVTSDDIWFHGPRAMAANGNQRVKMYAPSTWISGSSYSHLDYDTFNNTSNQLMVYAISPGESVHDTGVVTKGLLEDLKTDIFSPTVIGTSPADNATGVTLNANITATFSEAMDGSTITGSTFLIDDGAVAGTVTYSLVATFSPSSDLSPITTYTGRITTGAEDVAGNPLESDYTWTFTTLPIPPTVNTGSAVSVTESSTTLNGTVNPNGTDTDCYFEYGMDQNYGFITTSTGMGSVRVDVSVSADISGLNENTTYHYRLTATNESGTSYGDDNTFTTLAAAEVVNRAVADGAGGACFIATAAFGSPMQPYVKILREFRNRILLNNSIGKFLVNFYYKYSPPMADCISRHDNLRAAVRICLLPVVGMSWIALKFGPASTLGLFLLFALMSASGLIFIRKTHLRRHRN
jgi:hypothetical protein